MITIKRNFLKTVIAFGDSGLSLGKRSQEDLVDLAILAHSSQDPTLLQLFEKLPPMEALRKAKMDGIVKNVKSDRKTK